MHIKETKMANMITRSTNIEIIIVHKTHLVTITTILAIIAIAMNHAIPTIIIIKIISIPLAKSNNGVINALITAMRTNKADSKKNITLALLLINTVLVPPQTKRLYRQSPLIQWVYHTPTIL